MKMNRHKSAIPVTEPGNGCQQSIDVDALLGLLKEGMTRLVGQKLQDIRKASGITGVELAAELGIDKTLLSHYETGRRKMPDDVLQRYIPKVKEIALRRAKAVGAV